MIMEDDGTEQQEISSGTLTLNPDSTVFLSTMWTYISDGQRHSLPAVSRGYWSRMGTDSISIVSGTGFFAVGKLSSKKISLKAGQFEWVYTR
jgi:hypothetical protein